MLIYMYILDILMHVLFNIDPYVYKYLDISICIYMYYSVLIYLNTYIYMYIFICIYESLSILEYRPKIIRGMI
jgi:hypothetical protein